MFTLSYVLYNKKNRQNAYFNCVSTNTGIIMGLLFVNLNNNDDEIRTNNTFVQLPKFKKKVLLGFVIAVAQFDSFFQSLALDYSKRVKFVVKDITDSKPITLFGETLTSNNRYVKNFELLNFSRVFVFLLTMFRYYRNYQLEASIK